MAFNQSCYGLRSKGEVTNDYLFYVLKQEIQQLKSQATGSKFDAITMQTFEDVKLPIGDLPTQKQIVAECEKVDIEFAAAQNSIEKVHSEINSILTQVWQDGHAQKEVEALLKPVVAPTTKIQQNEIKEMGSVPVITQERGRLLAGYCDHTEPITDLPLIIFGDHSCTFKYVDFPFVRGADGTQLLKVDPTEMESKFLLHILETVDITNAGRYERHLKYLKSTHIPVPPLAQQKQLVAKIEALEAQRAAAQLALDGAASRKAAILQKYL